MALPLAHGLFGASVVAVSIPGVSIIRDWRALLMGAGVAICPDVDYLFYLGLRLGESWHRSFSHSIVFALAVGLLASSLTRATNTRGFLVYSLAALSHPILDALTSQGTGGVEFFWPLLTDRFNFGIVNYHDLWSGGRPLSEILINAAETSLLELAVFGPIFLATLLINRQNPENA